MEDWDTSARIWMATLKGVIYAIPAGVAFLNWDQLRKPTPVNAGSRRLWFSTACILTGLAFATWLMAPHLFEDWGRNLLLQFGWWWNRRPMQATVIGFLALATATVCCVVLVKARASWPLRLLCVGSLAIASETLIIAVSFHYVDMILAKRLGSLISVSAALTGGGMAWVWVWTAVASRGLLRGDRRPERMQRR